MDAKGGTSMELLRCTDLKKVYGKGDTAVCALNGIDLMV